MQGAAGTGELPAEHRKPNVIGGEEGRAQLKAKRVAGKVAAAVQKGGRTVGFEVGIWRSIEPKSDSRIEAKR